MVLKFEQGNLEQTQWNIEDITIKHSFLQHDKPTVRQVKTNNNSVRLHFGLKGSYHFYDYPLACSFDLKGSHNNILYSDGLEMDVYNNSLAIETFGIEFKTNKFIAIAQNGNDQLKYFAENVLQQKSCILSPIWRSNNFKIQQAIQEIIHCPYTGNLQQLFLLSKSIELLVLQADLYEQQLSTSYIKKQQDKDALMEARSILEQQLSSPPTIHQLSKLIGINEYKLKKGFKEMFGTTIFGYIHHTRMNLAKRLLLDSNKTTTEIAYEIGYSSPQHFSKAFKKTFKITPNSIRNNPDCTI